MAYVLCVGPNPALQRTLWFGALTLGEVNRARRKAVSGGGKGTNVARILGRFGYAARLLTFLGGRIGKEFVDTVEREGIRVEPVWVNKSTRVCSTLIEEEARRQTEIVEEAEILEASAFDELLDKFSELLREALFVVISGTSPPGAPDDLYGRMVERANQHGVPAIVDAPGRLLVESLKARPILAKPNRKELTAVWPELEFEEQMERLLRGGAQNVLVTDGGGEAQFWTPREHYRLLPPAINPVNPIGSGDAVAAGIAMALLEGKPMIEAVRFGIACGSANALTPLAGHVEPETAARLMPLVKVERAD